jgi:transposase
VPLVARVAAGNENEREHLLPLIDTLIERGMHPGEVWADRGYDSKRIEELLRRRGIRPQISKRRRARDPIPAGTPTRQVVRGWNRQTKPLDPQGRHRWPIERTNAWLKAKRRIATRRDRKADTYLAFIQLGMLLILARPL